MPRETRILKPLIILLTGSILSLGCSEHKQYAAPVAQKENVSTNWRSGDPSSCQKDRPQILAEYQQLLDEGKHWAAADTLRPCNNRTPDPDLAQKIRQAEIKSLATSARNQNLAPADRARDARVLLRNYPAEAKSYEKEFAPLLAKYGEPKLSSPSVGTGIRIGMTPEEVRSSFWGEPQDISRTITAYGTTEQWIYGSRRYLYFRNGRLEAIQE